MRKLNALIARNFKLFFKDKGLFFPSLIAPLILLFLFIAFLGNVYRDNIRSALGGFPVSEALVESVAAGWLLSSLLAVCSVTIAFTANAVMVQDKALRQADDIFVSPISRSLVALSYFLSTFFITALICAVALMGGLLYIYIVGWHLTFLDLLKTISDMLLLVLFGTALSSVICHFLKSQGGIAAIQMIVSAAYGFLCGAYIPLGSLVSWLKNLLMFLPGTYGTSLLHLHLMNSAVEAFQGEGIPSEYLDGLRNGFDCSLSFFDHTVPEWSCYLVLALSILVFLAGYIILCNIRIKTSRTSKRMHSSAAAPKNEAEEMIP